MAHKNSFPFSKTFPNNGTVFSGLSTASHYLKSKGYSLGTVDGTNPVAVVKGTWKSIGKWHNLLDEEKAAVDGVMESNDFTHGDVVVRLREEP